MSAIPATAELKSRIIKRSLELGFAACGVARAEPLYQQREGLEAFLSKGYSGEMDYLERNRSVRINPRELLPEAKSLIVLLASYYHPEPDHSPDHPRISRYALGEDYHKVLKNKGRELLASIVAWTGPVKARIFTDSAPILEREWARKAGLGWIGKNGLMIHPRHGSYLFIAEILTDLELPPDSDESTSRCGNCTRCLDACPTGALLGNGRMDPRKCISYLTIEHRSEIPAQFKDQWKQWIFGCDICQEVCPWNKQVRILGMPEFKPDPKRKDITWSLLHEMTPELFDERFSGSPVERVRFDGLSRNLHFVAPPQ